jgi:hypothetical protein
MWSSGENNASCSSGIFYISPAVFLASAGEADFIQIVCMCFQVRKRSSFSNSGVLPSIVDSEPVLNQ